MHFNVRPFESRLLDFFLASLEVIRRGHWNFYRYTKSLEKTVCAKYTRFLTGYFVIVQIGE